MIHLLNPFAFGGAGGGAPATLNPSDKGANVVLSGSDLTATNASSWQSVRATKSASTGIRYFEVIPVTVPSDGYLMAGVCSSAHTMGNYLGNQATGWSFQFGGSTANKINFGSIVSYGNTIGLSDVVGVLFDFATGNLTFYENGSSMGNAYTGISSGNYPLFPACSVLGGSSQTARFASASWTHAPGVGETEW